jgi:hypothetical protein
MHPFILTLVPCAADTRKACSLLRTALRQICDDRADLRVLEADASELDVEGVILALDSSRQCKATEVLRARRLKWQAAVYVPDLLAAQRLPDPSLPLEAQEEKLIAVITAGIDAEIAHLEADHQQETAYFKEMAVVCRRYRKEAALVAQAGTPSAEQSSPPEEHKERLSLAVGRFRNIFMRCDEITPPAWLATMHDVFQDACMCMTYGIQHWERGEPDRAQEFFEQAEHQAGPMLRHKATK